MRCPEINVPGTYKKAADRILRAVFDKSGGAGRCRCNFYPGAHRFGPPTQAEAFAWLDKWLRGANR